jgi:uncharacterized protein (DUF1697 family)
VRTFVALLRGVNVGKAQRVPMADFRAVLSGLGYSEVATLLNSGNAVFRTTGGPASEHARRIADALLAELRVDVPVVVKSARELSAIVAGNPIAVEASRHSRCLVAFARDDLSLKGLSFISSLVLGSEQFAIGRHAAYLLCDAGILQSKAAEALLGRLGKGVTTRNWATTLKLHGLANRGDT